MYPFIWGLRKQIKQVPLRKEGVQLGYLEVGYMVWACTLASGVHGYMEGANRMGRAAGLTVLYFNSIDLINGLTLNPSRYC